MTTENLAQMGAVIRGQKMISLAIIALAKAWIVSEVITLLHKRQKADFPRFQHGYRGYLPDWLKQTGTLI